MGEEPSETSTTSKSEESIASVVVPNDTTPSKKAAAEESVASVVLPNDTAPSKTSEAEESIASVVLPNDKAPSKTSESKESIASVVPPNDSAAMALAALKEFAAKPSWFTPKRLLAIFCVINMLNYVDRGAIASNGVNGSVRKCTKSGICTPASGIQGDFNLTNFKDGILSSAFMVGLLVSSPIFASLAKSHNPFRLIGVGLSVWTFATAGCGCSLNFWSITIFRMLVGVGEASFISLAAPFIDDNAPAAQKTAWLGIFYMCIPTGIAIGYIYGGLVGGHFNWRWAFWGEAIFMLPFAVSGFLIKPLQLKGFTPAELKRSLEPPEAVAAEVEDAQVSDGKAAIFAENEEFNDLNSKKSALYKGSLKIQNQISRLWKDMNVLVHNKVYVVNVLGYIAYNFVIGAYSYWGPKAAYAIYHMKDADTMFGGITVVCGIIGTVAGGFVLDYMNSTISNAFKLLSGSTLLGAIFCLSSFCSKSLYGFIALFSLGELMVFATQGPVNYVCLHSVTPSMRPLSMAMSTVSIHIFGDVPSSPLVGIIEDNIDNWRETALILTSILFVAAGIWSIGIFFNNVDRSNEDIEGQVLAVERSNLRPLLSGNTRETPEGSLLGGNTRETPEEST